MQPDDKVLFISASGLGVTAGPDGARSVAVLLEIPDNQLGLAPGLRLALRMFLSRGS